MITSLSSYEMKLVTNADILLTKNQIIQKVYELLGGISVEYKKILQAAELTDVDAREAKISRGENYKGLPYVILDFPRQFSKTDVFAVRTFFWWGNFFSITLQLSGKYKEDYFVNIEEAIHKNLFNGWFIGVGPGPWEHHFKQDNYRPISSDKKNLAPDLSYLKISKKIPLEKWDEVDFFLKENFTFLIEVLS